MEFQEILGVKIKPSDHYRRISHPDPCLIQQKWKIDFLFDDGIGDDDAIKVCDFSEYLYFQTWSRMELNNVFAYKFLLEQCKSILEIFKPTEQDWYHSFSVIPSTRQELIYDHLKEYTQYANLNNLESVLSLKTETNFHLGVEILYQSIKFMSWLVRDNRDMINSSMLWNSFITSRQDWESFINGEIKLLN